MERYIPEAFQHTLLQNHLGKCGILELLLILVAECLWLPTLQTLDTSEAVYYSGSWHLGTYLLGQRILCRESLEHRKQISLKFSLQHPLLTKLNIMPTGKRKTSAESRSIFTQQAIKGESRPRRQ